MSNEILTSNDESIIIDSADNTVQIEIETPSGYLELNLTADEASQFGQQLFDAISDLD